MSELDVTSTQSWRWHLAASKTDGPMQLKGTDSEM
ncbi:hypothetical protein M3J09_004120 [Ascochyta lentis]